MQKLAIAGIKLEGFPTPNGNIRVVMHSSTGQQELFVSIAEWSSIASIEHVLEGARRLLTEAQAQRDAAITERDRLDELHRAELHRVDLERARLAAENRELKAKHAAFVEASR